MTDYCYYYTAVRCTFISDFSSVVVFFFLLLLFYTLGTEDPEGFCTKIKQV